MPYCENCGQQNSGGAKYCCHCGAGLASVVDSHSAPTVSYRVGAYENTGARDYAWENSVEAIDRKRFARRESRESLGIFLSCVGVVAFIHALSLVLPGLERMLDGPLAWVLVAGMAVGCIFKVVWDRRLHIPLMRSALEMVVVGALLYGLVYGSIWTLKNYVITPGNVGSLIPSILAGVKTPTVGAGGELEVSGTVTTANLFMRDGPGREYPEMRAYGEGTVVKVVGKESGEGWVKVEAGDGRIGWMSMRFLRLSVGVERVPVVDMPPLPTPTKGG